MEQSWPSLLYDAIQQRNHKDIIRRLNALFEPLGVSVRVLTYPHPVINSVARSGRTQPLVLYEIRSSE